MPDCEHPSCSKPLIRPFHKAHSYLCSKSAPYHNWHHTKHHKKVHAGALVVYIAVVVSMLYANMQMPFQQVPTAHASTGTWGFGESTPSDVYDYDANVLVTGGNAQLVCNFNAGTDWLSTSGGTNWKYRQKITFDNSAQAENLVNFPAMIKLNSTRIDYSKFQAAGQDIRFADASNATVAIPHEIEKWDATGDSIVWVKVSQIDASSTTDYVWMYYGNSTVADGQSSAAVWSANYKAVYHLKDGVTLNTNDSIAANNGTNFSATAGTGVVDGGSVFNGSTYVRIPYSVSGGLEFNGSGTFEAWANPSAELAGGGVMLSRGTDGVTGGWGAGLYFNINKPFQFRVVTTVPGAAQYNADSTTVASLGTWYHIVGVFDNDSATKTIKIYINGNTTPEKSTNTGANLRTSTNYSYFGGGHPADARFQGSMDEVRISNTKRSASWVAATYKTETDAFAVFGSEPEANLCNSGNTSVTLKSSVSASSLTSFSEALAAGSTGTIKYQFTSNGDDPSPTWKYWNGAAWATASDYTNSNTAAELTANVVGSFGAGVYPIKFKWKMWFIYDGSQQPKVDLLTINYFYDTAPPAAPASITASSQASDGTDISSSSGSWFSYALPYFSWPASVDQINPGESASGTDGYYIYFGSDPAAIPCSSRGIATAVGGAGIHYQATRTLTIGTGTSALVSGTSYYLRIQAKDTAGNVAISGTPTVCADSNVWNAYTYKYDPTVPNNLQYVAASPSNYSATNSYTFYWPTGVDTGGSGIKGYKYKINSGSWVEINDPLATSISLSGIASEGVNIFHLVSVDNANNISAEEVRTNFYFAGSAASAPGDITTTPAGTTENNPATENSFSFSWVAPTIYSGSIRAYHYSINALPSSTNTTTVATNSLPAGPYATSQGPNTIYVVAEDETGNINYGAYSSATFYAQTLAPGTPTAFAVVDGSNRDLKDYKVFLTWTAPAVTGTGFAGYELYRSINGITFTSIGTTSGTTFADTSLESTTYYYYVASKDNADQHSAASSTLNITPTGRYTSPPVLSEQPTSAPKSFSANITWETDREASSFVYTSTDQDTVGQAKAIGDPEKVKKHTVLLTGLEPETTYYYQIMWEDVDGNQGTSDGFSFKTGLKPRVSDIKVSNITLESATISYVTTSSSTTELHYGKSAGYGLVVNDTSGSQTTNHSVNLSSLEDSSTYHYTIKGTDVDGNAIDVGADFTFDTLTRPKISNLRFEPVKDAPSTTLKFTWETNVPTTSIVNYQQASGGAQTQSKADYEKAHEVIIKDLADQSIYTLTAKGVDQYGNNCESDKNTFTTPEDTRAPKISNLTIEIKSNGFGSSQKAQIVASWLTDEPASSQLEYAPGIEGKEYSFKTKEDAAYTTNHVVIASELEPSKIYHLRAVSRDKAGNTGYSTDTTTITGKVQQSVVDVIVSSLSKSLGWVFNLFN